jgi:glycosyltransferase involved in cell wall biosynthesis
MKLLIDASSINKKNVFASISNYIIRLVEGFLVHSPFEIVLIADYGLKDFFKKKYPAIPIHYLKRNYFFYRIPLLGEFYGRWCYKNAIKNIPYDIEIIASDQDRSTRIKARHPRIFVVHDLKSIKDGFFLQRRRNVSFYQFLISDSHFVVAISEFTKNDVVKHFNIDDGKISIIPNSIFRSNKETMPKQSIPEEFILYVNTLLPHKNPITLIKAFEQINNQVNHKLVLVGKTTSYWKSEIFPYLRNHNLLDSVVHLQNLSYDELQYLYNKAALFVTPSLREGFGYTPIEAAISKVPVLSSTSEALPFSTQGLLYYYEPADDSDALACKMLEILRNPPTQETLNSIAKKFEQDYSSQKQIENFCTLIKKIEM